MARRLRQLPAPWPGRVERHPRERCEVLSLACRAWSAPGEGAQCVTSAARLHATLVATLLLRTRAHSNSTDTGVSLGPSTHAQQCKLGHAARPDAVACGTRPSACCSWVCACVPAWAGSCELALAWPGPDGARIATSNASGAHSTRVRATAVTLACLGALCWCFLGRLEVASRVAGPAPGTRAAGAHSVPPWPPKEM